jgi:hypothetical protein
MFRYVSLALAALASPLAAQQPTPATRADTLAIKKAAAQSGIDTAKAQLRVTADTAWVWHRRDPTYSIGVKHNAAVRA